MSGIKQVCIQVRRQKNGTLEQRAPICQDEKGLCSFTWDGARAVFETSPVPGGTLSRLRLELSQELADGNDNLALEKPVALDIYVDEVPEKITAWYLYNDWWTRPALIDSFSQVPERTQIALLRYPDRCACLVPAVGESFKAQLAPGGGGWLTLELTAAMGGQSGLDEPVLLWTEDASPYETIEKAFAYLAQAHNIRRREERRLPEMFRYLGWCSWDAFYTDISEEKVRAKARELREKDVPVRWFLMDDGWLSEKDGRLYNFAPEKEKFPFGFAGMIRDIKKESQISWFGVWHALGGYWGGILPGSPLEQAEKEHLCSVPSGKILPSPEKERGFGFFAGWYAHLKDEGISFVKVDGQSAVKNYFENSVPLCRAARGLHQALEGGASRMDGAVINCMGMAMENMLSRPASALSRSSDDFVPDKENGFAEHLLQNAYNVLYQGQLYHCDWDMFWTNHPDAAKHALLRAVSGGPVYFSDRIGETSPDVLRSLTYLDGQLLLMDRPALLAEECVFSDPMLSGVVKLTNTAAYKERMAGGIAVYNLTDGRQEYRFSPCDVPELASDGNYLIYDYFRKEARLCGGGEPVTAALDKDGFAWYQILPFEGEGAFLGLTEKYVGFTAVESSFSTKRGMTGILREQGPAGFASMKRPGKVFCNGADVTGRLAAADGGSGLNVYTVVLPQKRGKAVVEVLWE